MPVTRCRRLTFSTLFVAIALAVLSKPVGACRCWVSPVCGRAPLYPLVAVDLNALATQRGVVFVGVALEHDYPVTRFRVERTLMGESARELTVGDEGTSCEASFTVGVRYLVYAGTDPETGALSTACTRTRPMSDPTAAADLAYFEAIAAGREVDGWLSGVVAERLYDASWGPDGRARGEVVKPLAGIPVTVSSPGGETRVATTSADGVYAVSGLAPGEWRVEADFPAGFVPHEGAVVTIPGTGRAPGTIPSIRALLSQSCAEADVVARTDGAIRGTVLDQRGRPGRGISVELANVEALRTNPYARADLAVIADEEGRFEFRPLPAGQFVVGVDLATPQVAATLDRRRYHPGVRQLSSATVVELGRAARVQLEPFRLPELPLDRTITFVLRAPTPEIAAGTQVYLIGAAKQPLDLTNGTLERRLPFGAEYEVGVTPPQGHAVQFQPFDPSRSDRDRRIGRDDTDRTIEIRIVPR